MGVTLVWRADAHNSDTPPVSRTDDWNATILGKLAQVGDVAKGVGAAAVLDGGDSFHIKSPTRNSHRLVAQVAKVHKNYPCPVYACVGNHDVKYGDIAYLSESPLGTLFESGVYNRLYDSYGAQFERDGVSVRVVGIPYHGTTYDMDRLRALAKGTEDYLVVVAHLLASPQGGDGFIGEDTLKYADLVALAPDVWCFGHSHSDQGTRQIEGKWFVNIGSLSRGSLTQDEMGRFPACAILTFGTKGVDVDVRRLAVQPAADVFDVAGRERAETRHVSIEGFMDSLAGTLGRSEGVSLLDEVRKSEAPPAVKERAISYLERAGGR